MATQAEGTLETAMQPRRAQHVPAGALIHHVEADHCVAWVGRVELVLSRNAPTKSLIREIMSGLKMLEHRTGKRPGVLLIIDSSTPPPDEEMRAVTRRAIAASNMAAAAQVVEGTGFGGAAMRAVLSMLQLAIRPPFPMKVFGNRREGAKWLIAQLAVDGPAPMVSSVLHVANALMMQLADGELEPTFRR